MSLHKTKFNDFAETTVEHYLTLIKTNDLADPVLTDYSYDNKKNKTPNSFMIFRRNVLQVLKNKKINTNMTIVSKIAGKLWKDLPEEIKAKYEQISVTIKARFTEEKTPTNQNQELIMFNETREQQRPQITPYLFYDYLSFLY